MKPLTPRTFAKAVQNLARTRITPQQLESLRQYQGMNVQTQAHLLSTGQVTASWLHQQARFALGLLNPLLNAVENVHSTPEIGLPFIPKGSIPIQGLGLKYGLPLSQNYIPDATSPFILAMQKSLEEFYGISCTAIAASALPGCGMHSYTPGTKNPLNPEIITGGSSGGASSLVAAGVADFVGETDIGGSIRIPGAYQGRDNFKPGSHHAPQVERYVQEGKKEPSQSELKDLNKNASKQGPTYGFHGTSFGGLTWESSAFTYALATGRNPDDYLQEIKEKADEKKVTRIGVVPYLPTSNMETTDISHTNAIWDIAHRLKGKGVDNIEYVPIDPELLKVQEDDASQLVRGFVEVFAPHTTKTLQDVFLAQYPAEQVFNPQDPTSAFRQLFFAIGARVPEKSIEENLKLFEQSREQYDRVVHDNGLDFVASPTLARLARDTDVTHTKKKQQHYLQLAQSGNYEAMVSAATKNYLRENLPTLSANIWGQDALQLANPWEIQQNIPIGFQVIAKSPNALGLFAHACQLDRHLNRSAELEHFHARNRQMLIEKAVKHHQAQGTTEEVTKVFYPTTSWTSKVTADEKLSVNQLAERDRKALDDGKIVIASFTPLTSPQQIEPYRQAGFFIAEEWLEQRVHCIVMFKDPNTGLIDTITAYNSPVANDGEISRLMLRGPNDPIGFQHDEESRKSSDTNPVCERDRKAVISADLRTAHKTDSIVVEGVDRTVLANTLNVMRQRTQEDILSNPGGLRRYHTDFFPDAANQRRQLEQKGEAFGNCLSEVLAVWQAAFPGQALPLPENAIVPSFVNPEHVAVQKQELTLTV